MHLEENGDTKTQTFGLRKMLHRNEDHKIEIGARKNLIIGNLEAVDKKVRDGKKDYLMEQLKIIRNKRNN